MLKNKKSEDWKKMFTKHVFIGSVLRINVKIYKILLIIGRKIIQFCFNGKKIWTDTIQRKFMDDI